MSYTPMPGTASARVIDWLQHQPPGSMHPTAVIAEALAMDGADVSAALQYPAQKGLVISEKREGRQHWWGLNQSEAPADSDRPAGSSQAPSPASAAPKSDLGCALWNTGVLQIRKGRQTMELTAADTKVLVGYLKRLLGLQETTA